MGDFQGFQPGGAAIPATQVEISVSCRNLRNRDVMSKSDPMCVLFMKDPNGPSYREIGRTELIKDTLNPDFVHKFTLQYFFEESQKLKFEIYDVDSSSSRLESHDFLGRIECTLGEIVAYQGRQFKKNLKGSSSYANENSGSIILVADEVGSCKEVATMQFSARHLDKKDFFGKSDPFLVFYRVNEDNSYTVVHKTEVIKNTLDPTWRPFEVSVRALCNGDYERTIKIECYDWDSDGGHDYIGEFSTNLRMLSQGLGSHNEYECINAKKKAKKKNYKNSGVVKLMSIKIEQQQTFLDYIKGGTQLHFTVAVDFTASNGDPRDPRSLHFMSSSQPNSYALAIRSVGEIIQDYDSDKLFPALGFGAKLPPDGRVSHEFFLNGHPSNPYCQGIDGILEAYSRTLSTVQLYGPTNFAPVINHVARFAGTHQDGSNYFILLIITDGVISDMPYTKEAIVRAATLPMSIIIVGVGNADFGAMEELDGDSVRISSQGRYAERDIVQFVAFRELQSDGNWIRSQAQLAKEVLAEIPNQFLGYMKKMGIRANPSIQDATQQLMHSSQQLPPGPPSQYSASGGNNYPFNDASSPQYGNPGAPPPP